MNEDGHDHSPANSYQHSDYAYVGWVAGKEGSLQIARNVVNGETVVLKMFAPQEKALFGHEWKVLKKLARNRSVVILRI
jgi:hypothetical protein